MTRTNVDPRALDYDPGRVVACPRRRTVSRSVRIGERLRVADVMSAPAPTIGPDTPLPEVVHRIVTARDDELVVTVGSRPEGVITARGILALLDPAHANWRPRRAIDLVPTGAPRLLPGLDIASAVKALTIGRHEALPVVDYRGDLIGVVAWRHLITALASQGVAT